MALRDLSLFLVIFALLPFCFARPFVGVLAWTWLAFMNPHRLTWGVAWNFPFALLIGSTTLVGFVLSREPKRVPRTLGTGLILVLWLWMTLSTLFAHNPEGAATAWTMRSKIFLMLFVSLAVVRNRDRLKLWTLVTALSLGFYGLKGGIFVIATGGRYHVVGPAQTMLGGNNHLAAALNMTLPLLYYLYTEVRYGALRWLLPVTFFFSLLAVVGSYSRGAVLGLGVVLVMLVAKSRYKFIGAILGITCTLGVLAFLPGAWTKRVDTIATYQTDQSAMGRINAWRLAWRLALARPILGWGPEAMEDKGLYDRFYADSPTRNDVHSAYFQILSEGGFVTLGIWLSLACWALVRLRQLETAFRNSEDRWIANYASMFQVGLVGYMICAAFLEQGFFDLFYHFVGSATVLVELAKQTDAARVHATPSLEQAALPVADGQGLAIPDASCAGQVRSL